MLEVHKGPANRITRSLLEKRKGRRSHPFENRGDTLKDLEDSPVSERRGDKSHHLPVPKILIRIKELQWIRVKEYAAVVMGIEFVEFFFNDQREHFPNQDLKPQWRKRDRSDPCRLFEGIKIIIFSRHESKHIFIMDHLEEK